MCLYWLSQQSLEFFIALANSNEYHESTKDSGCVSVKIDPQK